MTRRARNFSDIGLTACLLGLIACPLPFVVLGARGEFPASFYLVWLAPFVLAGGYLLARALARPAAQASAGSSADRAAHRRLHLVLEGLSAIIVIGFISVVSGINLSVGIERLGAVSGSFLVTSLLSLPVALARRTALEARLLSLPRIAARAILALLLAVAGIALIAYLSTPPRFPG